MLRGGRKLTLLVKSSTTWNVRYGFMVVGIVEEVADGVLYPAQGLIVWINMFAHPAHVLLVSVLQNIIVKVCRCRNLFPAPIQPIK